MACFTNSQGYLFLCLMLCAQYGEIAFFGGLTASPAPLQSGTTRCDVTPVRESQRMDGVGLVFDKIFALPDQPYLGYCRVLLMQNTIPQTPLFFPRKTFLQQPLCRYFIRCQIHILFCGVIVENQPRRSKIKCGLQSSAAFSMW